MTTTTMKTPLLNSDDFLARIDKERLSASERLRGKNRAKMGQFMTPMPIATFMASMFDKAPEEVRLLDAGAGIGSLTAALVAELCRRNVGPRTIAATVYETDPALIPSLKETLRCCKQACGRASIGFNSVLFSQDFIHAGVDATEISLFRSHPSSRYNCAILNPPYRKIRSDSTFRNLLRRIGIETSNLYTAFVAIAIRLLEPEGQLIAITPRSFCNGPYFRPFRELLLDEMSIRRLHVFESRSRVFADDDVLQENLIIHAVKGRRSKTVVVSSSESPEEKVNQRRLPFDKVVQANDGERFIRLSISEHEDRVSTLMATLPATLGDLGIQVSTGRVVDFRAREFLRKRQ
jgi:adenine-specific DNA-methyltransferase